MSARQSVIYALEHKLPARVPYDVRFTKPARRMMAEYFGDPEFEAALGNCFTFLRPSVRREIEPDIWEDEFGVLWDRSVDKDIGVVVNRLITPKTLDRYSFPDPDTPALYATMEAGLSSSTDTFVLARLSYSIFERAWSLVGMEDLLMFMLTDKPFVHAVLVALVEKKLKT